MDSIKQHKHIIITGDQVNPLGVLRSIAEGGINPIIIYAFESRFRKVVISSRYVKKYHKVFSYEEAIDLLIDTYGNECVKPFVYTCDDTIASLIDLRYDELANKFFFFNAGRQGKINELLNKQVQCRLAEECGLAIPRQEVVDTGVCPKLSNIPY